MQEVIKADEKVQVEDSRVNIEFGNDETNGGDDSFDQESLQYAMARLQGLYLVRTSFGQITQFLENCYVRSIAIQ